MIRTMLLPIVLALASCAVLHEEDGPPKTSSLPKAQAQLVATGRLHACALTTTGSVRCWGYAAGNALGDNTTDTVRLPAVQVKGLESGVTHLATGPSADFSCAVVGGAVKCWGQGTEVGLGDGQTSVDWKGPPVTVAGLRDVTAVVVGTEHACALLPLGKVACWGANDGHQLGDGTQNDAPTPVMVAGLDGVTALTAGKAHTCALLANGTVKCWGSNLNGETGAPVSPTVTPTTVAGLPAVRKISAAGWNTCAITAAGAVWCWGDNEFGQLGDGRGGSAFDESSTPVLATGLGSGATDVAAGSGFATALLGGAASKMWGSIYVTKAVSPVDAAPFPEAVKSVSGGGAYICAIGESGKVYCWGDNNAGTVGYYDNSLGIHYEPKPLVISSFD